MLVSLEFLDTVCDLVNVSYDESTLNISNGSTVIIYSGATDGEALLSSSITYLGNNDEDIKNDEVTIPSMFGRNWTIPEKWERLPESRKMTIPYSVCDFYTVDRTIVEAICNNITSSLTVDIVPQICQYDSCDSNNCSEQTIVYYSDSQAFKKEDADSFAFPSGPDYYELLDLNYTMIGNYTQPADCAEVSMINATKVFGNGALVLTSEDCDHVPIIVALQQAGARAVIIGEGMFGGAKELENRKNDDET